MSRADSGTEPEFLWEQRRSWLCFGWHQPLVTPRWTDKKGQSLVAASGRPRTRAYRRVFKEKPDSQQDWDWCIVVNEQTDESGWSYGGCGFWEMVGQRMSLRSRPATLDLVKRRRWVHRSQAASLRKTGQMGSMKVMDPKQILEKQKAVTKELKEAKAAIWDLIDELDQSIHIKDMYMALLDPVALNRVSTAHVQAMLELQHSVLKLPAFTLEPVEVWKEALSSIEDVDRRSVVSDAGQARRPSQTESSLSTQNMAQRLVSRTRRLVKLTQKKTVMMAMGAGDLVTSTGRTVKSVIDKMRPISRMSTSGSAPNPDMGAESKPGVRPTFSKDGEAASQAHATSTPTKASGADPGPSASSSPAAPESAAKVKLSASTDKDLDRGDLNQQEASAGRDASTASGSHGATSTHGCSPVGSPAHAAAKEVLSTASAEPAGSTGRYPQAEHRPAANAATDGEQRPASGTKPSKDEQPGPTASSVSVEVSATASPSPQQQQRGASPQWNRSAPLRRPEHSGLFQQIFSFLGPDHPDYAPEETSTSLALSLPELQCAYQHACAVYGDLEVYCDGAPAQTFGKAITKFTGVPEEDVMFAVWRSEVFKPGHCLSIDHRMEKIVISIRGTYENADVLSDLVARPVTRRFSDGLEGVVHVGILRAAEYVLQSVWSALQKALLIVPDYPILVTGHSMGGGAAGLLALLLRHDTRLALEVRGRVRGVCLAPAAVMDLDLMTACQSFVASVVLGNDVVPRVGLHSFSKFVQEVAQASPYQRAKRHVKRTWRTVKRKFRGRKRREQRASSTGGGPEQPAASAPPDGQQGREAVHQGHHQHKILGQLHPPGALFWVIPQETSDLQPPGGVGGDLDVPSLCPTTPKSPTRQDSTPLVPGQPDTTLTTILASELDKETPKPSLLSCSCMAPQSSSEKSSKASKQLVYEMRQVGPEVFAEIFFFQKALMDHLPLEYLKGMRALVEQQELAVLGQHDPSSMRGLAPGFVETEPSQLKGVNQRVAQSLSLPPSKVKELRQKQIKLRSNRW